MITKYQRGKQHLEDAVNKADEKADEIVGKGETLLAKVKKSKWTAPALASAAMVAAFFILK